MQWMQGEAFDKIDVSEVFAKNVKLYLIQSEPQAWSRIGLACSKFQNIYFLLIMKMIPTIKYETNNDINSNKLS